jgi:hypothetical protein
MERYLTRIRKSLQRLAVSHAVPAGSREVTAAFNFISESTVYSIWEWQILKGMEPFDQIRTRKEKD